MKRLSVLLAGSALAVSAQAVNWSKVSENHTGSIFSVDLDAIEPSHINVIDEKNVDDIMVSIRRTYPEPLHSETDRTDRTDNETTDHNTRPIHHSEQQLLISCKDASYYRRAYVNYTADNKVLKAWQSNKPILTTKDFILTSPATIGRTLVEQACKKYEQTKHN